MNTQQFSGRDEQFLRRYEYDDSYVIAADLPVADDAVDVDVVDGTAIVVVETDHGSSQTEFDLPGPDGDVEVHNGVLTITVRK